MAVMIVINQQLGTKTQTIHIKWSSAVAQQGEDLKQLIITVKNSDSGMQIKPEEDLLMLKIIEFTKANNSPVQLSVKTDSEEIKVIFEQPIDRG
mmetsp:Transcript_60300/g.51068  ORF Transcript_60300/g.51068 Transcript_60300/m.51068 type:complete len:94 (+) Transcript_60300:990-1271(+)